MRVPWMSVVRKAMMPMKKKDSVRYLLSEIFSSSSTKRDSDSPTAPLSPDLHSKAHIIRSTGFLQFQAPDLTPDKYGK